MDGNATIPASAKQWIGENAVPVHTSFEIMDAAITVAEFRRYVTADVLPTIKARLSQSGWDIGGDDDPVKDIPWAAAQGYAEWLSDHSKDGCHFRLPTLAEWRLTVATLASFKHGATGAGTNQGFHWGMLEWTADICRGGGRYSIGTAWVSANDDMGSGHSAFVPMAHCLATQHVDDGFPGQGFRLVRVVGKKID